MTAGSFLRTFTFGHVRQLDAVSSHVLECLAAVVPRLQAGTDSVAFVDMSRVDDTIREVHGYKKPGATCGCSGVKGPRRAAGGAVVADVRPGDRGLAAAQGQRCLSGRWGTARTG